jgi:hypothetical protein
LYKHYSPRCQTALFTLSDKEKAQNLCKSALLEGKKVAFLCEEGQMEAFSTLGVEMLDLGNTEEEMANRLYGLLRKAEEICDLLIAIEPTLQGGVMAGVMNRLKKACTSVDVAH